MENKGYDVQDEMFRTLMQAGTEEVPAHIWSGLSARLDAGEHLAAPVKEHRPAWRRTLYAVSAVAAALAAGVLLWQNGNGSMEIMPQDPALAMMTESGQELAPVQEAEDISGTVEIAGTAAPVANQAGQGMVAEVLPTEVAAPEIPAAVIPDGYQAGTVAPEEERTSSPEEKETSETEQVQEELQDLSLEMETDEKEENRKDRKSREYQKFAVTLSGNAGGNLGYGKKGLSLQHTSIVAKPVTTGIIDKGNHRFDLPVSAGIGVKYNFTKRWAVSAGINYTFLSSRFDGIFNDHIEGTHTDTRISNTQQYIGIPVNFYYSIVKKDWIDFYTMFGGTVEKNVSNRYRLLDLDNRLWKEKARGVQWSVNAGIGVEFIAARWLGIYIDPSLRYYFPGSQPTSIRTSQPLSIGAEIGLRARF